MIKINLLPDQYRRAERTSPKLFAATLLGVVLVCSAFGWFGFVYFGELGKLEVEESATSEDLASKKKQATYYTELLKEKKEYEKRSTTIQSISKSRVLWTRIIDELIDVVNNDGDIERHLAWFKGVTVKPGDKKRGPVLSAPGWVQGDSLKKVADFHEDLEGARFFEDVQAKSPPSGVVETNAKRIPPEALFFNMKWTFKPTKDWIKNQSAGGKGKQG
ncbi:MAG: hypothetical protein AAF628_00910 [Planctomycetota bacterium]